MDVVSSAIAAAAVLVALVMATAHLVKRRRRQARDAVVLQEKQEKNLHIPRSLHPVIDTDLCIGSLSCLKACPEGDILGIQKHTATLVHADDEIMLITDKGVLVRTRVSEIRELGRATQGVTLIALDDGAKLSGLQRIVENDANESSNESASETGVDAPNPDGQSGPTGDENS